MDESSWADKIEITVNDTSIPESQEELAKLGVFLFRSIRKLKIGKLLEQK